MTVSHIRKIARKLFAGGAFRELKLTLMKIDSKKKYNRFSLLLGVPGILLQLFPSVLGAAPNSTAATGTYCLGVGLLIVGLAYYAKSKNRSGWWGLMGLLSIVGLIVLAILKDRSLAKSSNE